MEKDLNRKVKDYFENTSLENINKESIKTHFENVNTKNEYGGLLHAAVHNLYPEEKVLKFIKESLEGGVDVNLKGELTGYSFIHLALYGYTKDNEDYSYSTEFIVKIIELAKQFGLDIQIKDNDSDSIAHTAIASEIYTGSIQKVLEALGSDFDLSCTDNNGDDILKALKKYKKEAKSTNNKIWLQKIQAEEQEIKKLVISQEYSKEKLEKEENTLKKEIEELISKTNLDFLASNHQTIKELSTKIAYLCEKQTFLDQKPDNKLKNYWNSYLELIEKVITQKLKEIAENPSQQEINRLEEILSSFDFTELKKRIPEIKENYKKIIDELKEDISIANSLLELDNIKNRVSSLVDKEIVIELQEKLSSRYDEFTPYVDKLKEIIDNIEMLNVWLGEENSNYYDVKELKEIDKKSLTKQGLYALTEKANKTLEDNQKLVNGCIAEKCSALLESVFELEETGLYTKEELFEMITDSITPHKNKTKIKDNTRGKKE